MITVEFLCEVFNKYIVICRHHLFHFCMYSEYRGHSSTMHLSAMEYCSHLI